MKAAQEAKLNMYEAVKTVCQDNVATVATINAFKTAHDELKDKISTIKEVAQQQDMATTGIAADKMARKQNLSRIAAAIAGAITAYAAATGNNTLKQEVKFTNSSLLRTKDAMLAPRCQNIHDLGAANLAALADYGVTAAKLTELQTAIDAYAEAAPKPRAAKTTQSTIVTSLAQLFDEADAILTERMDTLIEMFAATNPDFVATYQSARKILDPQTTTTQLKGTVTNQTDNTPIAGATITIAETAQTANTDPDGKYLIKPVAHGTYTITAAKTGFNNFKKTGVEVKLGQVNSLDIRLVSS
ncbi:MAG: carboxypeptidase-like regulatory domain-containing protein [Acidobacteriota bacterium]|nr:carboxypeptidase-like regulatory domain-containing protein [Acidobacteriota bacterium]